VRDFCSSGVGRAAVRSGEMFSDCFVDNGCEVRCGEWMRICTLTLVNFSGHGS
jgi:hypothetical protein